MNMNTSLCFHSLLWSGWPLSLFLHDTLCTIWLFRDCIIGLTQTAKPLLPSLKKKKIPCCFLKCFKAICKLKSIENATGCFLSGVSGGEQSRGFLWAIYTISVQRRLLWGEIMGARELPDFFRAYVSSFSALETPVVLLYALWVSVAMGQELWRQLRMTQ